MAGFAFSAYGQGAVDINGVVNDSKSGNPVAGAKVALAMNPDINTMTDNDGKFHLTGTATVGVRSGAAAKVPMAFKGSRLDFYVAAVVAHVDHVVQLVGPEYVGISLDYVWDQDELRAFLQTMPDLFPDGFPDPLPLVAPEAWPAIVDGLLARGYDERALAMVAGGSWRRVAMENWREG